MIEQEDIITDYAGDKTITLIGRTRMGKGMQLAMSRGMNKESGQKITIIQDYYAGHSHQTYHKKDDVTTLDYTTRTTYQPKWLINKLSPSKTGTSLAFNVLYNGIKITFNSWGISCNTILYKKGIAFNGNINNINFLKQMNKVRAMVRKMFKKTSVEQLINISKETDDIFTIDYNKLKQLK